MVRLCENRLHTETHIFLSRGEPCSQRPSEMARNHADDIALIAESEEELQTLVDKVHHSSSTLGLKINVNNTEVQNISKEPKHIHIMIDDKELTQVDNFTYLGGIISQDGSNSQDIKQRIGKAMGAVQKLYNLWNSTNIRVSTKTELYRVLIQLICMVLRHGHSKKKMRTGSWLSRWHVLERYWV